MPPKRSAAVLRSLSSDTESENERANKRQRSSSPGSWDENRSLKVYIVQAKIDENDLLELFNLIETTQTNEGNLQLEQASDYADADVIVTNIRMKKRLERHIEWDIARQKAIVTPEWLHESVKAGHTAECGSYAALQELHEETVEHCPSDDHAESQGDQESDTLFDASQAGPSYLPPASTKPAVRPSNPRIFKNWQAKYACMRASPLICVNQALALEMNVLSKARELEGLHMNALSYEKSVAIIKSYPYLITRETFERDIKKLPGLGTKTLAKIEEFLENGFIQESRETRNSERFNSLSLFASIYGIGPVNARRLFDLGLRTVEDLERYYDVPTAAGDRATAFTAHEIDDELYITTPNGKKVPVDAASKAKGRGRTPQDMSMSIKIALMLREDLDVPIPRDEVQEMHRVVMKELEEIQPGCVSTIVGGYRRGKEQSGDVDIVISHPDIKSGADRVKGLCKRFTRHLHAKGLVTHVMHLSGFHAHNALRTTHWDSLEKALTVFVLPANPEKEKHQQRNRIYRRLDLIFASPEAYWTGVIGWSGSRLFQRDLRALAKEKGLKFDSSGLTRRHDSRLFLPRSEQEIFDILGLDWVDPTMRNANV